MINCATAALKLKRRCANIKAPGNSLAEDSMRTSRYLLEAQKILCKHQGHLDSDIRKNAVGITTRIRRRGNWINLQVDSEDASTTSSEQSDSEYGRLFKDI
jgi:hypothetical protein